MSKFRQKSDIQKRIQNILKVHLLKHRQSKGKGAPFIRPILHKNVSAIGLNDPPGNIQTKSYPVRVLAHLPGPVIFFKNQTLFIFGNIV